MSFRIKTAEEITAKMTIWYTGLQQKITDMVPGSVSRTKFESVAYELEAFYYQVYRAIKKAIATAIYRAFGFVANLALKASGSVTFTADIAPGSDIAIPKGTQVATVKTATDEERVYETMADATLLTGQTVVNVLVSCTVTGIFGNTGVSTVTVMKSTIPGIDSVSNAASFANGHEKETEEERRARFVSYIGALSRGTDVAIEFGAKTAALYDANGELTEQVKQAEEVFVTNGLISCYIYNGTGGTTAALVTEAQKVINGYKEATGEKIEGYKSAGDVCIVYAAAEVAQAITASIVTLSGYDTDVIETKAEEVTDVYINSLGIGHEFVWSELVERLMGISGVYKVAMTVPASDVAANFNEVIVKGTVSITVT
ncbi:baseplate J/gp47 family protein [Candidatus Pacearchaeota archaeon]|nr:baseplate J/gp47 family protein [Candidatus Pacearchaeota archaeon]